MINGTVERESKLKQRKQVTNEKRRRDNRFLCNIIA